MTTQTFHTGNNPDTIAVQGPVPTALTSPSSPRSRRFLRVRRAIATAAVSAVALTAFGVTWQIRADDDAPAVVPQRATEADLQLAAEWARRMEIPVPGARPHVCRARVVHRPAAGRRVGPSSRDPQHSVSAGDLGRPLTSARSPPPVHAAGRGTCGSALQSCTATRWARREDDGAQLNAITSIDSESIQCASSMTRSRVSEGLATSFACSGHGARNVLLTTVRPVRWRFVAWR